MDHSSFQETVHERIRDALVAFSGDAGLRDFAAEKNLTEILDSLGHFTFLLTLEQDFNVEVPDEQFTMSRMGTINGIADVLIGLTPGPR